MSFEFNQHGGAGAKPADKHRLEAGLLDNQRGEHIVSPEAADDPRLLEQLSESFGTGLGAHATSCITFPVFCTARIFEPVELVKISVNGAKPFRRAAGALFSPFTRPPRRPKVRTALVIDAMLVAFFIVFDLHVWLV